MRYFILTFAAAVLLMVGCSPGKNMTAPQQKDSTRVEIRKETVYVPDTVYIEIPKQTAERITRDSSRLENDYAISYARINADGTLYHNLSTKPQKKPVEINKPVERNDSIVYVTKTKTDTVTVERELSWWEQTQIKGFRVLAIIFGIVVLWLLRSPIMTLIKKII